ncbi:MAG: rubrerythrin [Angelakisella sp.]
MNDKNKFVITNRDRVLRAWENSTELVRDYESYAHEMKEDGKLSALFAEYARDEGLHAAKLLELLQGYEK